MLAKSGLTVCIGYSYHIDISYCLIQLKAENCVNSLISIWKLCVISITFVLYFTKYPFKMKYGFPLYIFNSLIVTNGDGGLNI